MALNSLVIVFILNLGCLCHPFSLPLTNRHFIAGVVEFIPDQEIGSANVTQNLLTFDNLATQAKAEGVQIIVFPEDAITGYIYLHRNAIYPYLENFHPSLFHPHSLFPARIRNTLNSPFSRS